MDLSVLTPAFVWAVIGVILIFCELFIPGLVIAFFGVGALVTSLAVKIFPGIGLNFQILIFIFTSVVFLFALRKYLKSVFFGNYAGDSEDYNFNIEIGKIVSVIELIQPGEVGGRVKYQGAPWAAKSEELITPGESVKIVGCENLTLIVAKQQSVSTADKKELDK